MHYPQLLNFVVIRCPCLFPDDGAFPCSRKGFRGMCNEDHLLEYPAERRCSMVRLLDCRPSS